MIRETFICKKCGSEHYWENDKQQIGSTIHGCNAKRFIVNYGETDCNVCRARYRDNWGWFSNPRLEYKDLVVLVEDGLMSVCREPLKESQGCGLVDFDKMKREGYIKELRAAIRLSKDRVSSDLWSNTVINGNYDFEKMMAAVELGRNHLAKIELLLNELKSLSEE